MKRTDILNDALAAICGDRDQQYGTPEKSFECISALWSAYLGKFVTPDMVADMMILFKVARNRTGVPKADNWVDIAGYAACGGEIQFSGVPAATEKMT